MAILIKAKDYVDFVKSKKSTPYVYGAKGKSGVFTQARLNTLAKGYPSTFTPTYISKAKKFIGKVCTDCSGLVCWPLKGIELGSSQLYSKAYARLPMSKINDFAPGVVLWKNGHVGIYIGKDSQNRPICMEAKGINYGTIQSLVSSTKWSYGLTFDFIDYNIQTSVPSSLITYKGKNPYKEPAGNIQFGSKGEGVCWVQWELIEAGFGNIFRYNGNRFSGVKVDGVVGTITSNAIKAFQKSAKLTVDGIAGTATRKALLCNIISVSEQ